MTSLSGLVRLVGHQARYGLSYLISPRLIIGIVICAAIVACLLAGPVMGDRLMSSFSAGAKRVAPIILVVGVGVLLVGILAKTPMLDAIGGSMVGIVLLAVIADNY